MPNMLMLQQLLDTGLAGPTAMDIRWPLNKILSSLPPIRCWRKICDEILTPEHPIALHSLVHKTVFANWDEPTRGPVPAWFPSDEHIENANITALMRTLNIDSYETLHTWSVQNRLDFWRMMIQRLGIRFKREFTQVADLSHGAEHPKWLVDAQLNIVDSCFNATDDAPAIVLGQELNSTGILSYTTYKELHALTNRVANGLLEAGFNIGDAIAVAMPMTVESVAIYLGIVKAGDVVVSIAESFAPHEIAVRLRIAGAKAIFTQDDIPRGGKLLPLYAKVVEADAPQAIVLSCRSELPASPTQLRAEDMTWEQFLSDKDEFESIPCHPHQHTNILFSSGTTGEPKAILWNQTSPIKSAVDGHLHHDIHPGDVVAWPTSLGWMMGPWLIYASLINHATIALYDGAPTGRGFGEFIQDARVTMLGVVPSLVRTWKNTECMKGLDWRTIKAFSSTGECSNREDMLFLMSLAGYRPIIEYCGGTEIGGGYITGTVVQPSAPATFSTPALGLRLTILDEEGHPTDNGEIFLVPPSIGLSTELLNRDHHQVYFEGTPKSPRSQSEPLRRHGDQGEQLGAGYYRIHGRVDDTMNLSGIKVSSAEIEQVLNSVNGIRETAAIAVSRPSQLVIYVVLSAETNIPSETLTGTLQTAIRTHLNPLFKIHDIVVVDTLPRTASNKVMRRVLRDQYTPIS